MFGLSAVGDAQYPDVSAWPLIGHHRELAQLRAAVTGRVGAVITGPTGVGKTTLASMGLEVAEDSGMAVVRVAGTDVWRTLPFGAFAALLPPAPAGAATGEGGPVALLRHYVRSLVEGTGGRPLVVFVDDAHLLDDASAMLVHQLAQSRSATVLATVLATERHALPAPAPIVALWKDRLAERIELGPLDDAQTHELLAAVLDGPMEGTLARHFYEHSLGNPLYLRELVTGSLQAGALGNERGPWQLRDAVRPTARLVELITLRFGDLTPSELRVLELTALGEPLSPSTLDELAEPDAIESLEHKGLICSHVDGRRLRINLAHPIYGDVVRVGISARRERVLARALAEATGGRRREDTLVQASLRLVGGGGSAALLLAGAKAARLRHDLSLTERLARAAVEKGDRFEGRLLAAETAHLRGRPEQADRELAALAADAESEDETVRVAVLRFDNAFYQRGKADAGEIDALLDTVTQPAGRDELLSRRLFVTSCVLGPRPAVQQASDRLVRLPSDPLNSVHVVVSNSLVKLGRLDDAQALLRPDRVREDTVVPAPVDWSLVASRAQVLIARGHLDEAEELLTSVPDLMAFHPGNEGATVSALLASLHLVRGRVQSAYLHARLSYTHFLELGRPLSARWPYAAAAMALALAGHAGKGAETLAEMDALGLPVNLSTEADVLHCRAWVAAAAGDLGTARQYLETSAELGQDVGDLNGASRALHSLARMGRARQVTDRLDELAAGMDGELVVVRAHYVGAVASRSIAALTAVAREFEDLGALLFAAEALGEAAVLLQRAGNAHEASANEHRAARLLIRCEGAVTPFVRSIGARAQLTPAELDTALQAVAGASDREIASQMHLSVRTIENRLHRTYQKLGLTRRHELAEALLDATSA
jgi:DNA-binding CsgD family transcriptional regulator